MRKTDDVTIVPVKGELLGDIENLTNEAVKSPEMKVKVGKMLEIVNATRRVPLELVEVISANRQVVNGFKDNIVLKLREVGGQRIRTYNLYIYRKADDMEKVEVRLTARR